MTPEETRNLVARARVVSAQLGEALDRLNESIRGIERAFVERLGPETRGRTVLRKNKDRWIEHLSFRDGKLLYESGWPGERLQVIPLVNAPKDVRVAAVDRMKDLWSACGGPPI